MRISLRSLIVLAFIQLTGLAFSQAPIRDPWDTVHAHVNYNFPVDTGYFQQYGTLGIGNDIVMYGDTTVIDPGSSKSFIHRFNPTTNVYTKINYTPFSTDRGIRSAAAVQSGTNTPATVFLGATAPFYEMLDSVMVLYKLNTSTNAITTETFQTGSGDYRKGIYNMAFFSPATNHDTLIIFNHRGQPSGDSVDIFKKHVNQTGIINSHITLPESITDIKSVFNYNNVLYIGCSSSSSNKPLINSTNGTTFSVNTSYSASVLNDKIIVDMDTLGGYLYLGLDAGDGYFAIAKTNDGVNFTTVVPPTLANFSGLQSFKNKLFYVVENGGQTPYRPDVRYIDLSSNDILSLDTIGRKHNDVSTFRLTKANNKLLLSGNYIDWTDHDFGTFVYKFVPPVANFSISSTNFCLNTPYSLVSNSTADSVRWFINTNYNASTSNTFAANFTSLGSNTVGLIAIIGTQKDTLKYTINIYSVSVSVSGSSFGCINNKMVLVPNAAGAFAPISYSWTSTPSLTTNTSTSGNYTAIAGTAGTYTYYVTIKDVNNCVASSSIGSFSINTNKGISGLATQSNNPVAGNVILYKYEPVLTKFDSLTSQATNASGGYTFNLQDANTYIISCEPLSNTLQITYAPSEISWKTATVVTHGCLNNTVENIKVIPIESIGTGPGLLSGKITEGVGYVPRGGSFVPGNPIGGLNIKGGKNPVGTIVAQSRTNPAGQYTLSGLPITLPGESYFILVDIPGLDTNSTYYRAITTGSTQYTDLDFVVDSALINPTNSVGIKEIKLFNGSLKVYPNPTNGVLNINCNLDHTERVSASIFDLTGKYVQNIITEKVFNHNDLKIETNINELNKGVYLLKILIGEEERTIKLIVTD
ncbi:MAG: T9SS type A sorting domain-containing protein [Sphingobacteriaceae bacterium]|jgi:hypothetical protein